jgi:hypothetical protein
MLTPSGRLLFTSGEEPLVWDDAMTGLESRSLGTEEYRRLLRAFGWSVTGEYKDEGRNHYFDALKLGIDDPEAPSESARTCPRSDSQIRTQQSHAKQLAPRSLAYI